jgi:hypothetical protein
MFFVLFDMEVSASLSVFFLIISSGLPFTRFQTFVIAFHGKEATHAPVFFTTVPTSPATDRDMPALKISSETPPPKTHLGSALNAVAVSTAFAPFEAQERAFQAGTKGRRLDIFSAVPALSIAPFPISVPATYAPASFANCGVMPATHCATSPTSNLARSVVFV